MSYKSLLELYHLLVKVNYSNYNVNFTSFLWEALFHFYQMVAIMELTLWKMHRILKLGDGHIVYLSWTRFAELYALIPCEYFANKLICS